MFVSSANVSRWWIRLPFFFIVFAIFLAGVYAKRGWIDWRRMVRENDEIVKQIEVVRSQKQDLDLRTQRLLKNPLEQERIVRRQLGYIKSDEIVIEFP